MSLYVTTILRPIKMQKPIICIFSSTFSFNGFFLIPSINKITTFPPSSGGNGNKLVTPKEIDIKANMFTNSLIPFVSTTTSPIQQDPLVDLLLHYL